MRTTLATPRLRLHPGVPDSIDIEVVNTADVIEGVAVTVRGIEAAWVKISPPVVTMFPEGSARVTLTFDVPTTYPSGDSLVLVELVSLDDASRNASHDVWLTVDAVEAAELSLRPSLVVGGGRAELFAEIVNLGNVDTEFSVTAVEPTRALDCRVMPPTVLVPMGGAAAVRIIAEGKRPWFAQTLTRTLQVTATSPTLSLTEVARFNQKPRIARGVLTALILAAIIALWALIFLLVVQFLQSRDAATKAVPDSWNAGGAKDVPLERVAGTVTGRVTAASTGEGLARITIEAHRVVVDRNGVETTELSGSTATLDDGAYDLSALLPGNYRLLISGDGFAPVWYPAAPDPALAEIVRVAPVEVLPDHDVVIAGQPGVLAGQIAPPEGADPAVPATVTVTPLLAGSADTTTAPPPAVTDDAGNFRIEGLATPATYSVRVDRPGFQPQVTDVTLTGGEAAVLDTTNLTAAAGTITGVVTDGGSPMGGVTVTVRSGAIVQVSTTPTVGDVGVFRVESLPAPRTYVITFEREGFAGPTIALDLVGGQEVTGVEAVMIGGQGTVTGAVRDAAGNPLGGVAITVTGGTVKSTTTSLTAGSAAFATGSYTVSGLPTPGNYTVTFELPGYSTETLTVGFLTAGQRNGADVVMRPVNGSISGTATVAGTGTGGLTVELIDGLLTRTTQTATGPPGAFSFTDVVPGAYTLRFAGGGVQPFVAVVEVGVGEAVVRNADMVSLR